MPIFFQWKWQENTETFLLIFHFDADGSKPNLRKREMAFRDPLQNSTLFFYTPLDLLEGDEEIKDSRRRTVVTWAPSHVEAGLISEMLSYANIINGFKKNTKDELRSKLEMAIMDDFREEDPYNNYQSLKNMLKDKVYLFGFEKNYKNDKYNLVFCTELCPEYINYLKCILKPYMA